MDEYVEFDELFPLLDRPKEQGGWVTAFCPAHPDGKTKNQRSLVLSKKRGVLKCMAGCSFKEIMEALNNPFDKPAVTTAPVKLPSSDRPKKIVSVYDYGELEKIRYEYTDELGGKTFRWRKKPFTGLPDEDLTPESGQVAKAPLWGLERLSDGTVFFPEGEKATQACWDNGFNAVCHSGGAGIKDFGSTLDVLSGREVVLWADDDTPGRKYMTSVATALRGKAKMVRLLDTGELIHSTSKETKEDAFDFFANGGAGSTVDDLLAKSIVLYRSVDKYPLDVLPPVPREFVRSASASVGVPPEMVALPLLAATASVIGSSIELELKPGFRVIPIIWGATVVDPGKRKTPAEQTVTSILEDLQLEAYQEYRDKSDALPDEAKHRVVMDHYMTVDTTMEALGVLLQVSPGILITPDELTAWIAGFDAYHKGGDRQKYLSLWSGKALKIDRKSAPPIFVKYPAPSIFGGIQPDFLRSFVNASGRDGFLERFLFCVPEVSMADWTEEYLPRSTSREIRVMFQRLRQPLKDGLMNTLYLSDDAKKAWVVWYNDTMKRAERTAGALQGFLLKLPQQVARISIVLHALGEEYEGELISEAEMKGAIEIGEYHYSQAERAFALLRKK